MNANEIFDACGGFFREGVNVPKLPDDISKIFDPKEYTEISVDDVSGCEFVIAMYWNGVGGGREKRLEIQRGMVVNNEGRIYFYKLYYRSPIFDRFSFIPGDGLDRALNMRLFKAYKAPLSEVAGIGSRQQMSRRGGPRLSSAARVFGQPELVSQIEDFVPLHNVENLPIDPGPRVPRGPPRFVNGRRVDADEAGGAGGAVGGGEAVGAGGGAGAMDITDGAGSLAGGARRRRVSLRRKIPRRRRPVSNKTNYRRMRS